MGLRTSYFMRMFYWDWDECETAPVFIKIPITILSPSPDMLALLMSIENFYGTECYLLIDEILEISDDQIGIVPAGVATSEAMLVSTYVHNGASVMEALCGITSASGEYALLTLDETGVFSVLMVDDGLKEYLGLEYIKEATDLHQEYLDSIGFPDEQELVYYPSALY